MSGVIFSRYKRAQVPFEIESMGIHLYSMEELAYFLYENISLIDRKILSRGLYDWIGDEIGSPVLRDRLIKGDEAGSSVPNLVLTILREIDYYTKDELNLLTQRMRLLQTYQQQERLKLRADEYFMNGNYQAAIQEYQKILDIRQSERLGVEFYAHVWNNLGVCFARMFLFDKAAGAFRNAYGFDKDPEILNEYICALHMYLSEDDFEEAMQIQNIRGDQLSEALALLEEKKNAMEIDTEIEDERRILTDLKRSYRKAMRHV